MVGASAAYLAPSAPPPHIRAGSIRSDSGETTLDGGASVLHRPVRRAADNNMTVNSFTVSAFASATTGGGASRVGWDKFSAHAKLMTIAGVCNRARYEEGGDAGAKDRKILGDASDAGLLRYCDKTYPVAIARRVFPKVFEIPFNSVNKARNDPTQPTHLPFS